MTLDPRITVTLDTGESVTKKMTFGLLNDLIKVLGNDPTRIAALDLDPQTSEIIIATIFAERDDLGKPTKVADFVLSLDDAERAFDWVKEHLLDYFLRRLKSTQKVLLSHEKTLKDLGFSPNGTESEASKTLSSSP